MSVGKKRILVIDDHEGVLRAIKLVLGHAGHEVTTATNGGEGIEKAVELLPDLIILDLMMPVMDGYEVARRLNHYALTSRIPIMVLSAKGNLAGVNPMDKHTFYRRVKERAAAFDAGAIEFVAKPIRSAELLETVNKLLRTAALSAQE
jgi:CheY-like chemotaxis protein